METRTLRVILGDPILTAEQIDLDPQSSIVFDTGVKIKTTRGHKLTFVEDDILYGMGIRIVVRYSPQGLSTVQMVFINTTLSKVSISKNDPILICKVNLFPTPWREYISNTNIPVSHAGWRGNLKKAPNTLWIVFTLYCGKVARFLKKIVEKFIKILDK